MKETLLSAAAVSAQADVLARLVDNGYLRVYDGTLPLTADDALTTQVPLGEWRFGNPSAAAAVAGVLTFNMPEPATTSAGVPVFFRAFKADGVTMVWQGKSGGVGANLNFGAGRTPFVAGDRYRIENFIHAVRQTNTGL